MAVNPENQNARGRFKPGNRAAVRGGEKMKSRLVRVVGEEGLDDLLLKEFEAAKNGDVSSRQFLLARFVPPVKAESAPRKFDLDLSDLESGVRSILAATAEGALPVDQSKLLIDSLRGGAEIAHIRAIAQELSDLKAQLGNQPALPPTKGPVTIDAPVSSSGGRGW